MRRVFHAVTPLCMLLLSSRAEAQPRHEKATFVARKPRWHHGTQGAVCMRSPAARPWAPNLPGELYLQPHWPYYKHLWPHRPRPVAHPSLAVPRQPLECPLRGQRRAGQRCAVPKRCLQERRTLPRQQGHWQHPGVRCEAPHCTLRPCVIQRCSSPRCAASWPPAVCLAAAAEGQPGAERGWS